MTAHQTTETSQPMHTKISTPPKKKVIVLTGGGTAGHVWPHFALFDNPSLPLQAALDRGEVEVHYVGSRQGEMEQRLVQQEKPQWTYHGVYTSRLRRYFTFKNFLAPFLVFLGFLQAFVLFFKLKPALVFSKGGFVAIPTVWSAWLHGVPVVIHESDLTPALTTKLSLPCAQSLLCAFSQTKSLIPKIFQNKTFVVGVPLRQKLFQGDKQKAAQFFNLSLERPTLLVFGGSLGARSLNQKVARLIPKLHEKFNMIHLVGRGNTFDLKDDFPYYRQYEFLTHEMALAYAIADVALCRAGASSLFELAAARIPMVLVPLGLGASRGDQIVNAKYFAAQGWATHVPENTFEDDAVVDIIHNTFEQKAERQKKLESAPGPASAAETVSEMLWDILEAQSQIS